MSDPRVPPPPRGLVFGALGYLFTYFAPLAFVLAVTLCKEAWEDWKRYQRDRVRSQASVAYP